MTPPADATKSPIEKAYESITEDELDTTPAPPRGLTHEEAIGWRHGWLCAQKVADR